MFSSHCSRRVIPDSPLHSPHTMEVIALNKHRLSMIIKLNKHIQLHVENKMKNEISRPTILLNIDHSVQ